MSEKSTMTERGYCSYCGRWLDKGEEHDWQEHPDTVHGEFIDD